MCASNENTAKVNNNIAAASPNRGNVYICECVIIDDNDIVNLLLHILLLYHYTARDIDLLSVGNVGIYEKKEINPN